MANPFVRLFLVRHGEVDANAEMRYLGRRDDDLNQIGRRQAEELGTAFADLPIDGVFTSPLQRASETALAIGSTSGSTVQPDHRLIELDFGAWEGLTRAEVAGRSSADRDLLESWERDPEIQVPDGESLIAVQRRMADLANHLLATRSGRTLVLVSHVGPIKTLICSALKTGLEATARFFLDPATISVVDWSARPTLRLFNSHAHLGWTRARWMP